MSPFEMLKKARHSEIPFDAVLILLAIGDGAQRFSDLRSATGLNDWQMQRMLRALVDLGMVEKTVVDRPGGRGKCSIYHLTGEGVTGLRALLSAEPEPARALRRRPAGTPPPLAVRAAGVSFLGE